MTCDDFQCLVPEYATPLEREAHETKQYSEWVDHMHECTICSDFHLAAQVRARGRNVSDFPCVHIAFYSTAVCDKHPDIWDCPDALVVKTSDGWGMPIRNGGSSWAKIGFCPWCGVKLEEAS